MPPIARVMCHRRTFLEIYARGKNLPPKVYLTEAYEVDLERLVAARANPHG